MDGPKLEGARGLNPKEKYMSESFAELFEHFAPRIKGFLINSGANLSLAEECSQEVMATCWHKAHMFDPSTLNVPMTNYALHQSSFLETYTERALNISRPQLNDTGLDVDVYLNETSYLLDHRSRANCDSVLLLQGWASPDKTTQNEESYVMAGTERSIN